MLNKKLISVLIGAIAVGVMTGCSANVSANPTVPANDIAETAADALEEQVGVRPDMDCGQDQVDLVDGTVVDCILTDPTTESTFDAPVTVSEVNGTDYTVSVEVADTPRS